VDLRLSDLHKPSHALNKTEVYERRIYIGTWVYLLYMSLYLPEREKIAHI
jgi:hypothetical protein